MKPNTAYVSEFEGFMSHFLEEHPEVVEDQRFGRLIYWDRKVDPAELHKSERDWAPEDGYGFHYLAWLGRSAKPAPR